MGYLLNPNMGSFTETKRVAFSGTTYSNVQVKLVLTTSNFDYAKTTADGTGLRFTAGATDDPESAYLPYWIESWSVGGTSIVWFKVPTVGTTQVFLRYGHLGATDKQTAFTSFMERGLRWESFAGSSLAGWPTYGGNDTRLNQPTVGSGSTQIAGTVTGQVSARWEGWLIPESIGEYTLGHSDDDGGRAWLDGTLVYNDWSAAAGEVKSTAVFTDTKPKKYVREFHDSGGVNAAYSMGVGARGGRRTNLCLNPSFEVDLGWWDVVANTTLARATTDAAAGTACMEVTFTNTTGAARYWAGKDVQPGSTYTFSYYVKATSGTPTMQATIYWHDRDGNYLSASAGTAAASTTGWTRYTVTGTAPANAGGAMLVVNSTSSANGNKVLVDAVLFEQAGSALTYFDGTWTPGGWDGAAHASSSWFDPTARVNLAKNPRLTSSANLWTTASTDQTTVYNVADRYIATCEVVEATRLNTTGAMTFLQAVTEVVPVSAGEVLIPSAYGKYTAGTAPTMFARIVWLDYNKATISNSSSTLVLTSSWARCGGTTYTAPAGACYARLSIGVQNTTVAGTTFRFTAPMLERAAAIGTYFDGGYPPAAWVGAADASASVLYPTDRANLLSNPSAEVDLTGWIAYASDANTLVTRYTSDAASGAGSACFKVDRQSSAALTGIESDPAYRPAGIPGETYYLSAYVKGVGTTATLDCRLSFYDASGALLGTSTTAYTLTSSWQRVSHTAVALANTATVKVIIRTTANVSVGQSVLIDGLLLEKATTLGTYFDGATAGSSWVGTAHASQSLRKIGSTTVTYPFPLSWVWGPKYDPSLRGDLGSQTATIITTPVGLDATVPQDVALWLDASDTATITASGGSVSALADKSGWGRNFAQSTAGSRPVTGTRTLNSKNVLDFDGTDDFLLGPAAPVMFPFRPARVFMVALADVNCAGYIVSMGDAGTVGAKDFGFLWNGSSSYIGQTVLRGTQTQVVPADNAGTNQYAIMAAVGAATQTAKYWKKGAGASVSVSTPVGTAAEEAASKFWRVGARGNDTDTGGGYFWNGVIAEVLVYERALSAAEEDAVMSYLRTKWGV